MHLICIPALEKHKSHIQFSLDKLFKEFSNFDFLIVTPNKDDFIEFSNLNIKISEDMDYLDLDKNEIYEFLNYEKKSLYIWYYQQLLKYSIIYKLSKFYEVITILDADSIILNTKLLSSNAIFLNENEYNKEYFVTIKKLFPEITLLNKSAINNYQTFTTSIFMDMIHRIEIEGTKWHTRLLKLINDSNDKRAFSEYETYANYASYFYNVECVPLKFYRRGDLLNKYESKNEIINKLQFLDYDIVAFEISHDIKLKHLLYSFYLFITYKLNFYVKDLFSKF
jgi:hypothetical protein